jgi:hypothetical protein
MRRLPSHTQLRHAALLWATGALAFCVAGTLTPRGPWLWLVAALFALNAVLALYRSTRGDA